MVLNALQTPHPSDKKVARHGVCVQMEAVGAEAEGVAMAGERITGLLVEATKLAPKVAVCLPPSTRSREW
jgi:hypothetical protein